MGKNLISFGPRIKPANSGQNPSHNMILYFHTRYSNENILIFWYRNQAIQKLKFIYTYKTTTLMKDSNQFLEFFIQNPRSFSFKYTISHKTKLYPF
jgi:hypothetical protein